MPIIKSAKKRVKVAAKANARNIKVRRKLRLALKAYAKALESGKPTEVAKAQTAVMSALDTAAKKAVIHKNKAARFKSRLSAQAKKQGVKPSPAKKTKPAAKKVAARARKPAKS
ncbi:30S ribosomal protein S20 [Candidatus Saccharibacteria bacterium]|nr:30S ribosomal protein S20 [Candidatus Saccharibacteria bacterium]